MNAVTHREKLVAFLQSLPNGKAATDQDILQLDSLALLQVVTYLESQYGLRLNQMNLAPDDLRSVDKILSLIERHTGAHL